ncbi:hypothetical protein [Coleofasciculus sp. H7-2]
MISLSRTPLTLKDYPKLLISSLLTPHSSVLSPHSSLLTPHSSLLKYRNF